MPFDGNDYGAQGLVPPYPHHPEAPALGTVLADSLRGAYAFCRRNARCIGHQTFQLFQRNARAFRGITDYSISSTGYVDVTEFHTWIPEWATHVEAELHFRLAGQSVGTVFTRIVITDGVDTDTGLGFSEVFEFSGHTYNAIHGGVPRGGYFGPEQAANRSMRPWAAPVTVKPSLNGDVTIRVQAYAVGTDGAAARIIPTFVSAFWTCIG